METRYRRRALAFEITVFVALLAVATILWNGFMTLSRDVDLPLDANVLLSMAYVLAAVTLPAHALFTLMIVALFRLPKARMRVMFLPLALQLAALLGAWLWCGFGLPFSIRGLAWVAGAIFLVTDAYAVAVLLKGRPLPMPLRALTVAGFGAVWAAANLVAIPAIRFVAFALALYGTSK